MWEPTTFAPAFGDEPVGWPDGRKALKKKVSGKFGRYAGKLLPLHPLSVFRMATIKRFRSLKRFHSKASSTRGAAALRLIRAARRQRYGNRPRLSRKGYRENKIPIRSDTDGILVRRETIRAAMRLSTIHYYNEEFDPGSG